MIALHGRAGLAEFDAHYRDPAVAAFRGKVRMLADADGGSRLPRAPDRQGGGGNSGRPRAPGADPAYRAR